MSAAAEAAVARRGTFGGLNVFLSRNLVAHEVFDALHDSLKFNGANVLLCCDPSRSSPNDFHVISSSDHEKFDDLRAKGCNLVGPQCVFSCAKERRPFPQQGYTCCLAMDGVKVLISGFDKEEKVTIGQFITAMGGSLQTKPSLDVDFVIVKNVLASRYKWALSVLKKPIVGMSWLHQCWIEHRLVPQERHRILPFSGLTICVTKLPVDERKKMEKIIIGNGGCYSADLTKKCTHLISDVPEGDKYTVARRWGHIHIVTRRWFDLSVARRACLDEGLYPVHGYSGTCEGKIVLPKVQENKSQTSLPAPTESEDIEFMLSQKHYPSLSDAATIYNEETDVSVPQTKDETIHGGIAEDSEPDDDGLYLSNCKVSLLGFDEKELQKLVILIRKGGGSRYVQLSEKLTHIIIGSPSETEKKEVRRLAAWGIINVVKASWLQECDSAKKELPVSISHVVPELLSSKDIMHLTKEMPPDNVSNKLLRSSTVVSLGATTQLSEKTNYEVLPPEKAWGKDRPENGSKGTFAYFPTQSQSCSFDTSTKDKAGYKLQTGSINATNQINCASNIFRQKSFCFSCSFPSDRRAEIIEWVRQGGGAFVDCHGKTADFIIECHGLSQHSVEDSLGVAVSSHWIRFCLEEGHMQDIGAHILFKPLRCSIPLSGFEGLRFCISQYEDKERALLRNMCRTLGAKFTEKLGKKVTHLLCKFSNGPKFEAACKWGIQAVTAEWLYECVRLDKMVPVDAFKPKPVTAQDREAGLCTVSQHPTQAACMVMGGDQSQWQSEPKRPEDPKQKSPNPVGKRSNSLDDDDDNATKRSKLQGDPLGCPNAVSNVADEIEVIEDLLAQSNKMQDIRPTLTSTCTETIFPSDHSVVGQDHGNSHSTIERHWFNRTRNQGSVPSLSGQDGKPGMHDSFSETQTLSQVVGYEEDLSGMQKIIDRVRSQSTTPTPGK